MQRFVTRKITAGLVLLLVSIGLVSAPAGAATVVNFDDQPEGALVFDGQPGVVFLRKGRVVHPTVAAYSGTNALSNKIDPADEFDAAPMRIEFSSLQSRVKLHTGVDGTSAGAVNAELRAYDDGGGLLTTVPATLGPGPTAIDTPLEVSASTAAIKRVELEFDAAWDTEVIDSLEFDTPGSAAPPDGVAPVVDITAPAEGTVTNRESVALGGTVVEERKLKALTVTISPAAGPPGTPFDFSFGGSEPNLTFGPSFTGPLSAGENVITVTAEDFAGNRGEDTVRVTYDTPPPTLNIFARGLEVTQGTQKTILTREATRDQTPHPQFPDPRTYAADPPLVTSRDTVVRLYGGVEGTEEPVTGVRAFLWGLRDGKVLPGSPVAPLAWDAAASHASFEEVTLTPGTSVDAQRVNEALTWNFLLPREWTSGSLTLVADVNSMSDHLRLPECEGCNDRANGFEDVTMEFHDTGVVLIRPWRVVWQQDTMTKAVEDWGGTFASVTRLFPVAGEDVAVPPAYLGDVVTDSSECSDILGALATADSMARAGYPDVGPLSGPVQLEVAFGVMSPDIPGLDCNGMAYRPGDVAIAKATPADLDPLDYFSPAHEIGHSLGLMHASDAHEECGGGECEADFPHPHGGIGVPGFDAARMRALDPGTPAEGSEHRHDFMSYGEPRPLRWISPTNYQRLYDTLKTEGASARLRPPTLERRLLVTGAILPGGPVELQPIFELEAWEDTSPQAGTFALALLDASGQVLHSRQFEPREVGHDGARGFSLTVPALAEARRVEVRQGEAVVASVDRSPSVPVVRLLAPNGGEQLPAAGPLEVRWETFDADGGPLHFALQYSADGGKTWRTAAVNLTATSHTLELANLAGSQAALLRVVASDGLNTASDASDAPFTVAGKAPRATIDLRRSGATYPEGAEVVLRGRASDAEDGALGGQSLQWTSSRDARIGEGSVVSFSPSVGEHQITLEATDASGQRATTTVTITIEPSKDPAPREEQGNGPKAGPHPGPGPRPHPTGG